MIWSRASQITTSLDRLVDANRGADDTKYDGLKKPSLVDAVYHAMMPLLAWSPGLADAAETAIHRWPACRQRRCTSIGGGGEAAPGGAGGVRRAGAGPGSHALPDGQPPVARHTCSHVVLGAVRQPCDWGPAHRRVSLQREPSLVPGYQMGMITQHCLQLPCSQAAAPGTISYPVQTEIQLSPLGRARPVGVGHMAVEAVQGRPRGRGAAASPVPEIQAAADGAAGVGAGVHIHCGHGGAIRREGHVGDVDGHWLLVHGGCIQGLCGCHIPMAHLHIANLSIRFLHLTSRNLPDGVVQKRP